MTDLNKNKNVSGRTRKEGVNLVPVEFLPKMPDLIKAPFSEVEEWVGKLRLVEEERKELLEVIDNLRRF